MHNTRWWLIWLSVFGISWANASPQKTFVVGCQDIDYFPHYNFSLKEDKGYAWAVLEAFSQASGHQFEYRSYPIKRLQRALAQDSIDFAYPDNADWRSIHDKIDSRKTLSKPLISAISATMVLTEREYYSMKQFRSLGVPHGFTPVHWLERIAKNRLNVLEVNSPNAAINLVLKNRVDGADVEYNVAQYLLATPEKKQKVTIAKNLPYGPVTFHLSTIEQKDIIHQLNEFIVANQALLTRLRHYYQLLEPQDLRDLP
ncbi:transporter substrate-binding domain-containing protein [Paraglaciecola chathamensis]|uniref:Transporter substrate-binding domain-containing protein n=1 Tax=Paraglaciecola chathamensis TaxID=368405 RepID=A0ABS0WK25_9ALTE|nr:transporter substrate-binding domain-containing protein [Paraglaciecola chathamensis]MBJ2138810.1 transporter substrate-binding domain-containing protein [Paraglaciecola chathamensis]